MPDIFGQNRPSGALGGMETSKDVLRGRRQDDINFSQKQAKFFDYMDASESRDEARKTDIAKNKAIREVIPSETEMNIESNITATEQTKASRELIEPQRAAALRDIHNDMTEEQYEQVARSYKAIEEGRQQGREPEDMYNMGREEIVRSLAADEESAREVNEWLLSQGITEDFNEKAYDALGMLSSYGLHTAGQNRVEHLSEIEWEAKIRIAQANSRASGDKLNYPPATQDQINSNGDQYSSYIDNWGSLQGSKNDETGVWSGAKGQVATVLTKWARTATTNQILKDPNVTPAHLEWIAGDIMNTAAQDMTDTGWMWGWEHGGDDFQAPEFINSATTAMSLLEAERAALQAAGGDMDIYELWKIHRPQIMARMKASHRTSRAVKPETKQPGEGKTNASQAAAPDKETVKNMKPATKAAQVSKINSTINGMNSTEKFYFDNSGKHKTPEYQKLLDLRKSLQSTSSYLDSGA